MMRPSWKPPWGQSTSDHAAATKSNEIKHNESNREKHQRPIDGHSVSVHSSVAQRKSKSRTFRLRLKPKTPREHHLAKITSSHHDKNDGKKSHQVSATAAKKVWKVLARAFAPYYCYAAKLTEDYISILEECNTTNPQSTSSIEQAIGAQNHIKLIQDEYECSEDRAKFVVRQSNKNICDALTREFDPKANQLTEKYLKEYVYTTNLQPICVSGTNDKQRNDITKIQQQYDCAEALAVFILSLIHI